MTDTARDLVARYYAAFNAEDRDAMLALLSEDVAHHVNQGGIRQGRAAFAAFLAHMARCYHERLEDIVILTEPTGTRVAAEFTVHGRYLETDAGLPEARGQRYALPACAFFTLRDGRIARVATHYNLAEWVAQVAAAPDAEEASSP
ncbi:MAG: nuclear transport factor 2 family protein [Rhodobacteraceae bacterium]|nr:nuclear transport factor 2 family protein [Paracoccaceae bacterium]